jgi:serine/threonine protein kinase
MQLSKSKNMIQILEIYWKEKNFFIVMEYADKGDLWNHL